MSGEGGPNTNEVIYPVIYGLFDAPYDFWKGLPPDVKTGSYRIPAGYIALYARNYIMPDGRSIPIIISLGTYSDEKHANLAVKYMNSYLSNLLNNHPLPGRKPKTLLTREQQNNLLQRVKLCLKQIQHCEQETNKLLTTGSLLGYDDKYKLYDDLDHELIDGPEKFQLKTTIYPNVYYCEDTKNWVVALQTTVPNEGSLTVFKFFTNPYIASQAYYSSINDAVQQGINISNSPIANKEDVAYLQTYGYINAVVPALEPADSLRGSPQLNVEQQNGDTHQMMAHYGSETTFMYQQDVSDLDTQYLQGEELASSIDTLLGADLDLIQPSNPSPPQRTTHTSTSEHANRGSKRRRKS